MYVVRGQVQQCAVTELAFQSDCHVCWTPEGTLLVSPRAWALAVFSQNVYEFAASGELLRSGLLEKTENKYLSSWRATSDSVIVVWTYNGTHVKVYSRSTFALRSEVEFKGTGVVVGLDRCLYGWEKCGKIVKRRVHDARVESEEETAFSLPARVWVGARGQMLVVFDGAIWLREAKDVWSKVPMSESTTYLAFSIVRERLYMLTYDMLCVYA
jgi:hypothetical protein